MSTIDDLLQEFPSDSRETLKRAWERLPGPLQKELLEFLKLFPGEVALWRTLSGLAMPHFKAAFGAKQKVAIVGPANVGKSTLYNQFVQSKADAAAVSPVPGTTRVNQQADAGLFSVIDTPGADAVGEVGEGEKAEALRAAGGADFLIVMFDAVQGIKRAEQDLFRELAGLGKPYVVILNKIDLVRGSERAVVEKTAANLHLAPEQVLPIAAKGGRNLERVLVAVAKAEPEIVAALGQALPAYRWRLAWTVITGAASTSAAIALTPLPFLDFFPLIAIQTSMVLGIARIFNYRLTVARARELVSTFALGYLGRTLFQQLSKLGGPPGWALSAAIASATTVVMGYAAIVWFEQGERLSRESLTKLTRSLTAFMVESIKSFGRRKPSRISLQERVTEALESSPAAEDRSALEDVQR